MTSPVGAASPRAWCPLSDVADAVAAIRAGQLVVIPTDTVYGLACAADRADAVGAIADLKGRPPEQPIALVAASVDELVACIPELRGRAALLARRLLPGPYTLVVPNPERRLPWLTGNRPDAIGIRVPAASGAGAAVLEQAGPVAATSANRHGEPDPRRLADVPEEVLAAVAATVDAGELPGTPSTVLDLTGEEPRVLREGAVSAAEALARVGSDRGVDSRE